MSGWWEGGSGFDPCCVWQRSFVEIDMKDYLVILSLLLIQEGQLSISGASNVNLQHMFWLRNKKNTMWIPHLIWNCVYDPYIFFLCPRLPNPAVGHIAFRSDVTSVHAYVCMCVLSLTHSNLLTSTFLFEVITWVLFMVGSWNLVCYLPSRQIPQIRFFFLYLIMPIASFSGYSLEAPRQGNKRYVFMEIKVICGQLALNKMLFSIQKYWYFSYFFTKT